MWPALNPSRALKVAVDDPSPKFHAKVEVSRDPIITVEVVA